MTISVKNFGGRPRREPRAGERVHAGLRVTPELKGRIERAAKKSGRSLSSGDGIPHRAVALTQEDAFGSGEMHDMALRMATVFAIAGESRAVEKGLGPNWLDDPDAYVAGVSGVLRVFIVQAPRPFTKVETEALVSQILTLQFGRREKADAR